MSKNKNETTIKEVATAIGIGLIAGFAGTVAITISQRIEMKRTGRKSSKTPANAVREVFDLKPVTESKSMEVSNEVHWMYGTSLGLVRGALSIAGLRGMAANALHFAIIWGGKLLMLPALKVAKPVTEEKPKAIITEAFHHLVYAITAGWVYDAINSEGRKKEKNQSEDKFEIFRKRKDH